MAVPDHNWRVAQLVVSIVGFMAMIATTAFYAGKLDQRMHSAEGALSGHIITECHGQICVRVAVLENEVLKMALSIENLVDAIKDERERSRDKP